MTPDNNSTLYDKVTSELEKMPNIKIIYRCADVAPRISSHKTIVVENKEYANMNPKKKHTENP